MASCYEILNDTQERSEAYIAGWLKALKNDPTMLIAAASKAQKAFQHIVPEESCPLEETTEEVKTA